MRSRVQTALLPSQRASGGPAPWLRATVSAATKRSVSSPLISRRSVIRPSSQRSGKSIASTALCGDGLDHRTQAFEVGVAAVQAPLAAGRGEARALALVSGVELRLVDQ